MSLVAGGAFTVMSSSLAGAQSNLGQATEVTAPSNAGGNPGSELNGLSCTSAGNCVGVGNYVDSSGRAQAMEATETTGTWGQATQVAAPSNAGGNPNIAILSGVSCTSAGNCVAVGGYTDSFGREQAMAVTETGGTFGQATELTAPSNALSLDPGAALQGVSCTSAGNCVAVGDYIGPSGYTQAMEATESGGTWGQATQVTSPSNTAPNPNIADLLGVSCTSAGNCVAVGGNSDSSGDNEAMVVTDTGGTFGQATDVTAPSNTGVSFRGKLFGVSCTSAGNCVAVGDYTDSFGTGQAMAVTETGGTFGQATEVTAPSNGVSNLPNSAALHSVSCTSVGNCVGVGSSFSSGGVAQAMEATETGGTWGQGTEVLLPSNAGNGPLPVVLNGVSCAVAGNCVAVGTYFDSSGNTQAMAASSLAPTTTTLSSSANPSYVGQPVTFTATVAPGSGSGAPTGTVSFSQGTTSLGTTTLNSSGQATITTSALTPGADPITASYSGDNVFAPSPSATLTQSVTGCPAGDTAHLLTATTNVGTIYGLFCVNSTGFGTYQQGSVAGFGAVVVRANATAIGAIGHNLGLLGARTSSSSPFVELAPLKAQGTFVLG